MLRRKFIRNTIGSLAIQPFVEIFGASASSNFIFEKLITSGPAAPLTIYNNWSSYDELSDNIPLTEELAMSELQEVIRLKKNGVQIDYYMMDAFWFDKTGGYRKWHKGHWPNGPDKWLNTCIENNIKPGMWFSTNLVTMGGKQVLDVIPEWQDSLATDPNILSLFNGGYLKHLIETLQIWYNKGVRAFKFDFAYFNAATKAAKEVNLPAEIEEMNKIALIDMLKQFRTRNANVLITGYNGFGGDMENSYMPFRKTIDPRWMEVFDTIYCGDPRFSDTPMLNIWRSQDNYSDHMVRQYEFNGLPLRRIDNCAFMIGKTGTCYYRGINAWKGMMLLEYARGGWVNVIHGNLELLSDDDARWFAKAQDMFLKLQRYGLSSTFGAIPGKAKPYGFKAEGINGTVTTIVNPSQSISTIELPVHNYSKSSVIFTDSGFRPIVNNKTLKLGPEQLVVLGFDEYADDKYVLGMDDTIHIPLNIDKIDALFASMGKNTISSKLNVSSGKHIRIVLQQFGNDGFPFRSWGGAPPDGKKMNEFLKIVVKQSKKNIPVKIEYDKMIWSGLSWGVGEIKPSDLDTTKPLEIICLSREGTALTLKADVYEISY